MCSGHPSTTPGLAVSSNAVKATDVIPTIRTTAKYDFMSSFRAKVEVRPTFTKSGYFAQRALVWIKRRRIHPSRSRESRFEPFQLGGSSSFMAVTPLGGCPSPRGAAGWRGFEIRLGRPAVRGFCFTGHPRAGRPKSPATHMCRLRPTRTQSQSEHL